MFYPLDAEVYIMNYLDADDIFNYYQGLDKFMSPRVLKILRKKLNPIGKLIPSYFNCRCGKKIRISRDYYLKCQYCNELICISCMEAFNCDHCNPLHTCKRCYSYYNL